VFHLISFVAVIIVEDFVVSFCLFIVLIVDLCIACFLSFHQLFVSFPIYRFPTLKKYFILVVI
jgi:hypothetical protein